MLRYEEDSLPRYSKDKSLGADDKRRIQLAEGWPAWRARCDRRGRKAPTGRVITTARAAGIATLECYSTLVAERFYSALGFRGLATITIPMPRLDRPGEFVQFPAVLMRCELG